MKHINYTNPVSVVKTLLELMAWISIYNCNCHMIVKKAICEKVIQPKLKRYRDERGKNWERERESEKERGKERESLTFINFISLTRMLVKSTKQTQTTKIQDNYII